MRNAAVVLLVHAIGKFQHNVSTFSFIIADFLWDMLKGVDNFKQNFF